VPNPAMLANAIPTFTATSLGLADPILPVGAGRCQPTATATTTNSNENSRGYLCRAAEI